MIEEQDGDEPAYRLAELNLKFNITLLPHLLSPFQTFANIRRFYEQFRLGEGLGGCFFGSGRRRTPNCRPGETSVPWIRRAARGRVSPSLPPAPPSNSTPPPLQEVRHDPVLGLSLTPAPQAGLSRGVSGTSTFIFLL